MGRRVNGEILDSGSRPLEYGEGGRLADCVRAGKAHTDCRPCVKCGKSTRFQKPFCSNCVGEMPYHAELSRIVREDLVEVTAADVLVLLRAHGGVMSYRAIASELGREVLAGALARLQVAKKIVQYSAPNGSHGLLACVRLA